VAQEYGSARGDHAAIALAIGQCYEGYRDPSQWSVPTRAVLLFNLGQQSLHTLWIGQSTQKNEPPALNAFHTAAISYSDRISRDRVHFSKELEDSHWKARLYQTLILVTGAFATIAIGVRSILPQSTGASLSITIGICAMSLSAAGTAVSSMSSFDGSLATALRDQRTLSQLQQLHWRVASDVLAKTEICKRTAVEPGEAMKQVDAWKARLETILDSAVENIAQPGDLSKLAPPVGDAVKPLQAPDPRPARPSGPSVGPMASTSVPGR